MAGQTLQNLLAWMHAPENQVMWGWDAIAVLARSKTNSLLIQDYIARFAKDSYLPAIAGHVDLVDGQWREYIHDFTLDAPRLSFELSVVDGHEITHAELSMAVLGGSQIAMKREVGAWLVAGVSWMSPVQGPRLLLDLQLDRVPGVVSGDGRVYLDLRLSDDFRLTFTSSLRNQRLAGGFFKDLFNALPDEKRIFLLGTIKQGGNPLMRPQSFKVRAQSSHETSQDGAGEGAVVVFIQMEGSALGAIPGAGYPYLVPNDAAKDYSATVLFSRARIEKLVPGAQAIMPFITHLLGPDARFDYVHDAQGALIKATSKDGRVRVDEKGARFSLVYQGQTLWVSVLSTAMEFSAGPGSPLTVTHAGSGATQVSWVATAESNTNGVFDNGAKPPFSITHRYTVTLQATYGLSSDENGHLALGLDHFSLDVSDESARLPGASGGSAQSPTSDPWLEFLLLALAGYLAGRLTDLEPAIKEALNQLALVNIPLDDVIRDSIELNFGQAITDTEHYAPRDVGAFGRINPVTTEFAVRPQEPLVFAGMSQNFSTSPPSAVTWSLEALPPGNPADPGSISSSGFYDAPAQQSIPAQDGFLRVRVTATANDGYHSSALVTVLSSRLTVNPLIQTCHPAETVELQAGGLTGASLSWSIADPVADSGVLTPGAEGCSYTAKSSTTDEGFLLDKIRVSGAGALLPKYAYVLVVRQIPLLAIRPDLATPVPAGQLQLRAWVNKVEVAATWSLATEDSGSIGATTGLFSSASDSGARFALVFAEHDSPFGLLKTYLILPLPLLEYPAELQLMSI